MTNEMKVINGVRYREDEVPEALQKQILADREAAAEAAAAADAERIAAEAKKQAEEDAARKAAEEQADAERKQAEEDAKATPEAKAKPVTTETAKPANKSATPATK